MPNACMRSLFIAIRLKFDITNMGGKVNKGIHMWCVSDQVGGLLGEKMWTIVDIFSGPIRNNFE